MQQHLSLIHEVVVEMWPLPGRHWKWRMHGAGGEFAHRAASATSQPDLIMTTDMLDVASLKGLLPANWKGIPVVQYFHENQLTFPWSERDTEKARGINHTYEFINIQSAIAADWVWFNSSYHRDAFIQAAERFIKRMPDLREGYSMKSLTRKSSVLPVGIEAPSAVDLKRPVGDSPTILWNHRWEYDKGPNHFLDHLNALEEAGYNFRLILCGRQYKEAPPALQSIRRLHRRRIVHDGYASTREAYCALIESSDFIIHQPVQEYFGVSVAEAMSYGVTPLLKADQAYLSWVPQDFLFERTEDMLALWEYWLQYTLKGRKRASEIASQFYWPRVAQAAYNELQLRFPLS
jgi:glycosyltransferase involved in cell wall biosynthesis